MPTQQGPSTVNRQALQQLALAAPEQFGKISAGLKALQPEYKEAGGVLYEIPTYGGEVREVAGQRKEDLAGPVKQATPVLGINKPFAIQENFTTNHGILISITAFFLTKTSISESIQSNKINKARIRQNF